MRTPGSASVQYVFLDVVRFTQNRSVEAQTDIVQSLNAIVKTSLEENEITISQCMLLPTGDGIAIAIPQPEPFDLSLRIAKKIISDIHNHNDKTQDQKRKFEVRVGVNQNMDNIITDINGNDNVAGRGINMAQRVMSLADGGQIILGQSVFEVLREREAYEGAFRELLGKDKHGSKFPIYQLIRSDTEGLNVEWPSQLRLNLPAKPQMTEYAAHLIAHAVVHHDFLINHKSDLHFDSAGTAFLHLLARDSMDNMKRSYLQTPMQRVKIDPDGSPEPGYLSVSKSDFWIVAELANQIRDKLWPISEFFEQGVYQTFWAFPTPKGRQLAEEEFPQIWAFVTGKMADSKSAEESEV